MAEIASIEILAQPDHGHVSVNPDHTLSFVGTGDTYVGPVAFEYRVHFADGTSEDRQKAYPVEASLQDAGWGTGEKFYMLPVDASDRLVIEHGDNHRKVYIANDGLTAADIAALHPDVTEAEISKWWLINNPQYGSDETLALGPELGFNLWREIIERMPPNSNWLLLKRGDTFQNGTNHISGIIRPGMQGESPLHPIFIGAYGEGPQPKVLGEQQTKEWYTRNFVVSDVDCNPSALSLEEDPQRNMIFDRMESIGSIQGNLEGVTIRNTQKLDAHRNEPGNVTADGKWAPHSSRVQGMYVSGVNGLLFDGVLFDRNGWDYDFLPDGSVEGGQPPSMYSHGVYLQASTRDVTMRNSIIMRAASAGVQFRGGAHVIDTLFLDQNYPFSLLGGDYLNAGPVGNYSLVLGSVITHSARRGAGCPNIGATDWGVRNEALLTAFSGNIVAHANDPADTADTAMAQHAKYDQPGESLFSDDTIIWRWGMGQNGDDGTSLNVEGLDPVVMDATTIQTYAASLSLPTATDPNITGHTEQGIANFAQYLRTLDKSEYGEATQDVLSYFRAGFGIAKTARTVADTLRFVPDERDSGVRWDVRLNWDSGDLPGTVAGDSVDLGGNKVVFAAMTTDVVDLTFGRYGILTVNSGKLTVGNAVAADETNALHVGNSGQVWFTGSVSMPDVTVTSGRFATTSDMSIPGSMTVTNRNTQAILATTGTTCTLSGDLTKDALSKVGFDGDTAGDATLTLADTSTLRLNVSRNTFYSIGKFRSGAFGDNSALTATVNLGGSLTVDMAGYSGSAKTFALIEADQIAGAFASVEVLNVPEGFAATVETVGGAVNLVIV